LARDSGVHVGNDVVNSFNIENSEGIFFNNQPLTMNMVSSEGIEGEIFMIGLNVDGMPK